MASITLPSKGRGYTLNLDLWLVSQSIDGNYSVVGWNGYINKGSGSGAYSGYGYGWGGPGGSGGSGGSFNFRNYSTLGLGSGTFTVGHNADGTAPSWSVSLSFDDYDPDPELGDGSVSASIGLTTIPRATQPSVSPTSGYTASAFTINHSPASASFRHDVYYSLNGGGSYTLIASGAYTSTSWTPAHTLLPSATSSTVVIAVNTFSGSTYIGQKTTSFSLYVPDSVIPTVSSVSWVDSQTSGPDIPTLMGGTGRFVQRWSNLKPTVTSAGAGGSSVTSSSVTLNSQTTASGTDFGSAVQLSGSVPFTATAVDTRGRSSASFASTVTVKAYNYPSLPTPTVTRTSDAAGTTPSPTGTYLRITPNASASLLNFGDGEKNLLEWRIRTQPTGGAWTTVQDWTATSVSGNTWTTPKVIAGYASSSEWVVEVSIRDLFGKNGFATASTVQTLTVAVPSESVFMDWDGTAGIGLGKYRANGRLDVAGQIYSDSFYVAPIVSVATKTALNAVTGLVGGQQGYVTGDSVTSRNGPYQWLPGTGWVRPFAMPTGQIVPMAGTTLPPFTIAANGATLNIADYPDLYAAIGTTWGGDGTTTFVVPNTGGRALIGAGTVTDSNSKIQTFTHGTRAGEITHIMTVAEMASHTHAQDAHSHAAYTGASDTAPTYVAGPGWESQNLARNWRNYYQRWDNFISWTVATNQYTGSSSPFNVMQPYMVVTNAIRL